MPLASAATAAEAIDMPPGEEDAACAACCGATVVAVADAGCWWATGSGGDDGFDDTVDAERIDDGVGGEGETSATRCTVGAVLDVC